MTHVGPPIRVGFGPAVGAPLVVDGTHSGAPVVVVGGGPGDIEDLTNVIAENAPTDSVLVKGSDGYWRPRPLAGDAGQVAIDSAINAHVADTAPHPTYDDMPSLRLLYENGLI